MKHQEKKFRVDSFESLLRKLAELGAVKRDEITSNHYYAPQETNDVMKVVSYSDHKEIHLLKENDGKYSLVERIPVEGVGEGLNWLKNKGYKEVGLVKMINTDYDYKDGIIGLYLLNDFLHSVILDFPVEKHETIEREFELGKAEVIDLPYNKYLEKIGQLKSIKLS